MLLVDRPWALDPPHAATWGAVLGVGLLSTALAYVFYFRILAAAGITDPAAGHVLDPRQRHPARCGGAGRNAAAAALLGHGADRGGPRGHRGPAAAAARAPGR